MTNYRITSDRSAEPRKGKPPSCPWARGRFDSGSGSIAPAESTTTITYTYDPLYRLTEADYSDGRYFRYTYDSVGNRLAEEKCIATPCTVPITNTYVYDSANRLTSVNGQPYTWDDNGNLLNDGTSTYAYDAANRLTSVTSGSTTSSYTYNGLGDRLSQTVNSVTTNYVLDMNAGLTQVLAQTTQPSNDPTTYLYGNGRIGELQPGGFAYHLGDALGSVRQLTNSTGTVTLARSFEPYGSTLSSAGSGSSVFAFAGEQVDITGLSFNRARYYASSQGRFLTADSWPGDAVVPATYNAWLYVTNNPINGTDPSGREPLVQFAIEPYDKPVYELNDDGSIRMENGQPVQARNQDGTLKFTRITPQWSVAEKLTIHTAARKVARALATILNGEAIRRERENCGPELYLFESPAKIDSSTAFLKVYGGQVTFKRVGWECATCWGFTASTREIWIYQNASAANVTRNYRFIIHELGHAFNSALGASQAYNALATAQNRDANFPDRAEIQQFNPDGTPVLVNDQPVFTVPDDYYGFAGMPIGWQQSRDAAAGEEFADMFLGWVYGMWETDGNDALTPAGQARADFMADHMPGLAWIAFNR